MHVSEVWQRPEVLIPLELQLLQPAVSSLTRTVGTELGSY